jgi:RimJ/RimL family protein N-acetyltransferase
MAPLLKTERLTLRPVQLDDAPRIAAFTREPDIARMVSVMPDPQPLIAAEGFILISMARLALGRDYVFAIDLPGVGLVGVIGAHPKPGRVEIGYWVGKPHWGRGFATEAARATADFAASLDAGPVTARHFADNPASGRVLQKAGFVYTGEVKPIFSLSRGVSAPSRQMVRAPALRGAIAA